MASFRWQCGVSEIGTKRLQEPVSKQDISSNIQSASALLKKKKLHEHSIVSFCSTGSKLRVISCYSKRTFIEFSHGTQMFITIITSVNNMIKYCMNKIF